MMISMDMKKEREYVFLSLMIPQQLSGEVRDNSANTMADAANALEHNLMHGFAANLPTPPKVVNVLPIGSYPQYYKQAFVKKSTFSLCGRNDHINLGFCNVKLIRNYFIEKSVYKYLNDYCKKKNGELVLCIYSASAEFLSVAEKIKKKYPNIVICDIIADLPGMTNLSSKKSTILRWFIEHKAKKSMRGLASIDCFVLLTKQMAEYLHIKKPFCVVEGISTETTELNRTELSDQKIILYTGTLHKKFGVMNLVEAFQKIDDPQYRLVICGIGDSAEAIRKAAEDDSRISFLGQLPRDEVLKWQKKATVLVNPRQNNEEFTKYSFPSKTMEYLSSGIPVVAYKLDGIPDEYDQYIQYVEDDSINALKNKLVEICELPTEMRQKIGYSGRTFVLNEKNSKVQVRRIVKMLDDIRDHSKHERGY